MLDAEETRVVALGAAPLALARLLRVGGVLRGHQGGDEHQRDENAELAHLYTSIFVVGWKRIKQGGEHATHTP